MCMFCQQDSREALQCPARSTKALGSGYTSLVQRLLQFQAHGHMPMDIDDGDGCEVSMRRHHACWHKSSGLNFNQTQLDRLMRRNIQEETAEEKKKEMESAQEEKNEEEEGGSGMRTRSSIEQSFLKEERCLISFVMSQLALQVSTMLPHMTLIRRSADVQWNLKMLIFWPSLHQVI